MEKARHMLTAISQVRSTRDPEHDPDHRRARSAGQLVEGPHIEAFETAFAARLGGVRAISTSYGRMAFYYILKALDLPPGGEIVMPALTFWVMPEIARQAGLTPVFADVDPVTFNITAARHRAGDDAADGRCRTDAPVGPAVRHGRDRGAGAPARPRGHRGLRACARRHSIADAPSGTLGDAAIFSFQTLEAAQCVRRRYGGRARSQRSPRASRILRQRIRRPAASASRTGSGTGACCESPRGPTSSPGRCFRSCTPARGCTGASTCTSGRRSGRSIRCPEDYRERISNVQAAHRARGARAGSTTGMRSGSGTRTAMTARWPSRGVRVPVRTARPHARLLSILRLRARARRGRRRVPAARCRSRDAARRRLSGAGAVRRGPAGCARGACRRPARSRSRSTKSLTDAQLDRVAAVVRDAVLALDAQPSAAVGERLVTGVLAGPLPISAFWSPPLSKAR